MSVSENRVLRKYMDLTGKWKRLHGVGLRDLHCSPNIIRVNHQEVWDGGGRSIDGGE